jgi:hypothetical protein
MVRCPRWQPPPQRFQKAQRVSCPRLYRATRVGTVKRKADDVSLSAIWAKL